MQGRLSKQIGNKIQAFPEKYWKSEFSKAKKLGLKSIEWTLDYKNLYKNPIFKNPYTKENAIPTKAVSSSYNISRDGLESLSSNYVQKGEIMFFNLGGEDMSVVFSNIGDGKINGSDVKDWVIIAAPSNY